MAVLLLKQEGRNQDPALFRIICFVIPVYLSDLLLHLAVQKIPDGCADFLTMAFQGKMARIK